MMAHNTYQQMNFHVHLSVSPFMTNKLFDEHVTFRATLLDKLKNAKMVCRPTKLPYATPT